MYLTFTEYVFCIGRTLSVTVRVFEVRVLNKTFDPKREKVTG
jgi:hypothetical protein